MKAAGLMVAALVIAAVGFCAGWVTRGELKPVVAVELGPRLRKDVGMDVPNTATGADKRDPVQYFGAVFCSGVGMVAANDGKCYSKTERMPRGVKPVVLPK